MTWLLENRSAASWLRSGNPDTGKLFDDEWCSRVIRICKKRKPQKGTVFAGDKPEIRTSKIRWVEPADDTRWLYELLTRMVTGINSVSWHFDITHVEHLQFTEYAEGGFYGLHADDLAARGHEQRKISISILLNDDFEGGRFSFQTGETQEFADLQKGEAVVFPSFVMHRVSKVTSGVRYSLVAWVSGPAWK